MLGVFIIEVVFRCCDTSVGMVVCTASLYCVRYRLGVLVSTIFVEVGDFEGWVRMREEGKELCTTLPTCCSMDYSHMRLNQTSRTRTYKTDSEGQNGDEKV
jgi:hypothetical protein